LEIKATYTSENPIELKSEDVIVGIRPEFLLIKEDGPINGLAYSTLPSGMETTVKIDRKKKILSAVQFGAVDYAFDQKIKFDIIGNKIVLFDKESTKSIALGTCEVIK
jgi:multiple sugar transport system ATP-binding protein